MNNNIDITNFDKMLELAEFGAKRHNERRQNLFKAIIAYITLLVLALYYSKKILGSDVIWILFFVVLLVSIHGVYLKWLWTTLVASINDARRRDFYLKKAELLSYHLSRSRFSSFVPDPCEDVILNLASERSWKITERCLFEMREPRMMIGEVSRKEPSDKKWYKDIHFWMLGAVPTAILFLLVVKLVGIFWALAVGLDVVLILLVFELLRAY